MSSFSPFDSLINYSAPVPAAFRFRKVDAETGNGLPGAKFDLLCQGKVVASSISGQDGTVCFPSLCPGCYTLREDAPPAGYLPRSQIYRVDVDIFGKVCIEGSPVCNFRFCNVRGTIPAGSFTGTKRDTRGNVLEGAVFELRSGAAVVARADSNQDGRFTFDQIKPGTYTLVETQPPAGHVISKESWSVEVKADGTVTIDGASPEQAVFENAPVQNAASFRINDSDTGAPISGAVFELASGAGVVDVSVSDENGVVLFQPQAPGTYTIRERAPADGYLPHSDSHTAVIGTDGTVEIDGMESGEFSIGSRKRPNLRVYKTDENGASIEGAHFLLHGANAQTAVTNEEGNAFFTSLEPGQYALTETTPPAGYQHDAWIYQVIVEADGTVTIDGVETNLLTVLNCSNITNISGTTVWDDNYNAVCLRPASIVVLLFRDGQQMDRTEVPSGGDNRFAFCNLPRCGCDGKEYVYTVAEQNVPVGYVETVDGFTITNTLTTLTVQVDYVDIDTQLPIMEHRYQVYHSSDFTEYAPTIEGYLLVSPDVHTLYHLTGDASHKFYYRKIDSAQPDREPEAGQEAEQKQMQYELALVQELQPEQELRRDAELKPEQEPQPERAFNPATEPVQEPGAEIGQGQEDESMQELEQE